ncbi:MAG TPA: coenzyme F420-0:L-glutamate ligase [Candidatus Bathyarchaeia archaeon]|nr:coenzyme F420-0:L-glutamate ligase [Candidatus Bathyarchaeia archaeon]
MPKYRALALTTKFWKPAEDFLAQIIKAVEEKVDNGDFVVVSEKAISTATGRIVDESRVKPGLNAKIISNFWMRFVWGFFLGVLCRFGQRLILRLRRYPIEYGSRHKQVALQHAGLLRALMFGSEGGIDGSNLPYSYVSLPLENADGIADQIHENIRVKLCKKVTVIIMDTDKTYSLGNFHFTPRPKPLKGIHSYGGVVAYVAGRMFKLRKRSTPIAVAGAKLQAEEALKISNIADRARGPGSGATVWDMAARFGVGITDVSWDMLAKLKHKPIVIVRKAETKQ